MTKLSTFEMRERYKNHLVETRLPQQAKQVLSETDTALRWVQEEEGNFKPQSRGRKVTNADKLSAREALKQIPVSQVARNGQQALERYCERNGISSASRNTYRARFGKFLQFAETQTERRRSRSQAGLNGECPRQKYRGSHSVELPLTSRDGVYQRYRLNHEELPSPLREQVEEFEQSLVVANYPGQYRDSIEDDAAKTYLKEVYLLLGYIHRFCNIPLEDLSLDFLVPYVSEDDLENLSPREQKRLWRKRQQELEVLIFGYFQFLEEYNQSFSPRTRISKLTALLRLCEFRYRDQVQRQSEYKQIPIYNAISDILHQKIKVSHGWEVSKTTVANYEYKLPDPLPHKTMLTTVREKVLTPSRQLCRHRYHWGDYRPGWAIATSTQNYLKLSFMADVPPRRQSEYREIKLAMSCPIEKPDDVPSTDAYWPLPPVEVRDKDRFGKVCDSYIYKVFSHRGKSYPEGVWIVEIRNYKTDKTHGVYVMPLPNRRS